MRQHMVLRLGRVGEVAREGEDMIAVARGEVARQVAVNNLAVERGRHRYQHGIRYALQKIEEIAAQPPMQRRRARIRRCGREVAVAAEAAERLGEARKPSSAALLLRE